MYSVDVLVRKAESHINDFLYLSTYNVLYYE